MNASLRYQESRSATRQQARPAAGGKTSREKHSIHRSSHHNPKSAITMKHFVISLSLLLTGCNAFQAGNPPSPDAFPLHSSITDDWSTKDPVVPQTTTQSTRILHGDLPVQMQLPKKSIQAVGTAELAAGRMSMIAAVILVGNELFTGESLPDQFVDLLSMFQSMN